jgi:hypothetical protein
MSFRVFYRVAVQIASTLKFCPTASVTIEVGPPLHATRQMLATESLSPRMSLSPLPDSTAGTVTPLGMPYAPPPPHPLPYCLCHPHHLCSPNLALSATTLPIEVIPDSMADGDEEAP